MTQATVAAAYRKKLASNPDGEIALDTIQISDPNMTRTRWFVADQVPLTATLEDGVTAQTFEPANVNIKGAASNADLSQSASFTFADPENELDDELTRILEAGSVPVLTFRTYLVSDMSYPAWGPVEYEAQDVNQEKGKFTVSVSAPRMNSRGTGLIVTPTLCPLLRGMLS